MLLLLEKLLKSAPKADKVYRVAANAEFAPFESLDSAGNVEGFEN